MQHSLRKIKAYSDKEKKLIEKQVEEFKQECAQSSASSDIDRLLLDSSEVIMDEVLGKVRARRRTFQSDCPSSLTSAFDQSVLI